MGIVAASFLVMTGFGSTRGEEGSVLVGSAVGVPALVALVALAIAAAGQADEAAAAARGSAASPLPPRSSSSSPPRPTWGQ